jgi:hypothetical protein
MFTKSKLTETPGLEEEIQRALSSLADCDPDSEEYAARIKHIDKLISLRRIPKTDAAKPVDPNIVLTLAVNLIGIVAVLQYEQARVITSKALAFVIKPKV